MEQINAILDYIKSLDETTIWATKIFAVVFVTVFANFVVGRVIKHLIVRTEKSKNLWDDAFIYAARRPLRLIIWVVGLTLAIEVAYEGKETSIFSLVHPARDVLVIVAITWFALRFIRLVETRVFTEAAKDGEFRLDRTTVSAVAKLLRIATFITAVLIGMQTLGASVGGVLAFGGIGGMAVGFAAKDLLANFFGAMMLYLDRPFSVGDWVRSPDRNIEGTVEAIGWRLTIIRTFDKRPLYVPNSVFATIAVENPSRMTNRRIYETIGVRYDDMSKVGLIAADVEKMLKDHKDIDTNQTLMVNLNSFSESSVDFFIYTFTKTTVWTEFHDIKQDVLLKINEIIEKHGAEFAYPTSTIHVPNGVPLHPELEQMAAKKA